MTQDKSTPNCACETTTLIELEKTEPTLRALIDRPMGSAHSSAAAVLSTASRAIETAAYDLAGTTDTTVVADLIIIAARLDMIAQRLPEDTE